jgi:hypothetical protein
MIGKLGSLLSYWKCLEVYTLKRFPSNKLPMFGMIFTYFGLFLMMKSLSLNVKTRELLKNRLVSEKNSSLGFNDSTVESCHKAKEFNLKFNRL